MSLPIQITVGGTGQYDPAPGATSYFNPTLVGKQYYIEKIGYGTLSSDSYTVNNEGGFDYPFADGEILFIHTTGFSTSTAQGTYSNGFDLPRVMSAMFGRLGFKQPTEAGFNIVDSVNTTSRSGRYFDQFHALVTAKNIRETASDPSLTANQFNTYLSDLQRSSIIRALNRVFNKAESIEDVILFDRYGLEDKEVTNTSKFVGFRFKVASSVQINRLRLLFNESVSFTLYLFHDGNKSPIWSGSVSAVANEITYIELPELVMTQTRGGNYYLGYFQDEIGTAKAISEEVDCWTIPHCFRYGPVESQRIPGEWNFDRKIISDTSYTYGLNVELTSFKDRTENIIRNAKLFDELIGLQMAYMVIESIIHSTRSNGTERMLREGIDKTALYMDLKGTMPVSDAPTTLGLDKRIAKEIEQIQKSFEPNPRGISICS